MLSEIRAKSPKEKRAAQSGSYVVRIFSGMNISEYRSQTGHDRKGNEDGHERQAHNDAIDYVGDHTQPEARELHSGSGVDDRPDWL